jgi:hypothetical protein
MHLHLAFWRGRQPRGTMDDMALHASGPGEGAYEQTAPVTGDDERRSVRPFPVTIVTIVPSLLFMVG